MGHNGERETQSQDRDLRSRNWLLLGASLLGGAVLAKWMFQQRATLSATRQQMAVKAEVEARLGVSMKNSTWHEMMALDCLILPDSIDVTLGDIGGLDKIIGKLMKHLSLCLSRHEKAQEGLPPSFLESDAVGSVGRRLFTQPKGILLYGPPGTGKTMMVKAVANHVNAFILAIKPSNFQSKYSGETNKAIAGVFKLACRLASEGRCCILFIDDVDTLLGRCSASDMPVSMKAEFLLQWDSIETDAANRIIILGTTNRPQALGDSVCRRFTFSQELTLPGVSAREEILLTHLHRHCRQSPWTDAVDQQLLQNASLPSLGNKRPLQWIAELTEGYSGADLYELAAEAAQNSIESIMPSLRQQALSMSVLHIEAMNLEEQPAVGLSDFEAALAAYRDWPTQQKAASN